MNGSARRRSDILYISSASGAKGKTVKPFESILNGHAASANTADPLRRRITLALLAAPIALPACSRASADTIRVWTGPSCGCCHEWVDYLRQNGFSVETFDGGNREARARLGMPERYGSCHTGEAGDYAIEGHVPVREIRRLLAERPDAVGIAVPAMPIGSPGMDGPAYGDRSDPYDVFLVGRDGGVRVYQSYP